MRSLLRHFLLGVTTLLSFQVQAQDRSHQFNLSPNSLEYTTTGSDKKAAKRMLVFEALAQDLSWSPASIGHAGTIFQHTNTENEPDDGEEYRSQEMHLLTFFLYKEKHRIEDGVLPIGFLGPYRYTVVMGLPKELSNTYIEDSTTKTYQLDPHMVSDQERLRRGFPFALLLSLQTPNPNPLPPTLRNKARDEEIAKLIFADQQTRALFKKDEMIFNRYIERIGDAQRRARLYEMMAEDVMWDSKTLFAAARTLHDTPSIVKRQDKTIFQLQENHLLAYFLARQAFLKGEKEAGSLIVASLNTYIKVSKMPDEFGLRLATGETQRICPKEPRVSMELWGKYEFPFHLGRTVRALCEGAL